MIATATFRRVPHCSPSACPSSAGVSLSIESAQARIGRPLTPVSVAGVARRQRPMGRQTDDAPGHKGAGLAAGAIGTAAVAATSPWGYGGGPYAYGGSPYATTGWSGIGNATVPGVTMHVNLLTPMAAVLSQLRTGAWAIITSVLWRPGLATVALDGFDNVTGCGSHMAGHWLMRPLADHDKDREDLNLAFLC